MSVQRAFNALLRGSFDEEEPRKPVDKEKLVTLAEYCKHTTGDVVLHRDQDRWYCVFNGTDGEEVIDSKEIYVDLGPGAPQVLDLQLKSQVKSIAEVVLIQVIDNRIDNAYTAVKTTRKRFELERENKLLDYLFVEAA